MPSPARWVRGAEAARQARLLAEWETSPAGRDEMALWDALASVRRSDLITVALPWPCPASPGRHSLFRPTISPIFRPSSCCRCNEHAADLPLMRVTIGSPGRAVPATGQGWVGDRPSRDPAPLLEVQGSYAVV